MKMFFYKIALILLFPAYVSLVTAQETGQVVNLEFLRKKIELGKSNTFFNILKITNLKDEEIEFTLNINTPKDWKLIGSNSEKITIPGGENISIPIRVVVSKKSRGGVGYSVTANLINSEGAVIASKSSYFKFPVKENLKIKAGKEIKYFDHKNLESSFFLNINNQGNIHDYLDIKVTPSNNLLLDFNTNSLPVYQSFSIKPQKDTLLRFNVRINRKSDYLHQPFFYVNIEIKSKASDSIINRKVWFRYVNWYYENLINESDRILVAELTAQNIFNSTPPQYKLDISGKTLLKKNREVFYSFENNRRSNNKGLWFNSRIRTGFKNKKTTLLLGDYIGNFELNMYGRGFYVEQKIKKSDLKFSATKRMGADRVNYGVSYKQKIGNTFVEPGFAYSHQNSFKTKNLISFVRSSFKIGKSNSFIFTFGENFKSVDLEKTTGFGYHFNYRGNYKKFDLNLLSDYGSSDYVGYYRGRFNLRLYSKYKLNNPKNALYLYTANYINRPQYQVADLFFSSSTSTLKLSHQFNHNLQFFIGGIYKNELSNSFSENSYFGVQAVSSELGIRVTQSYNNRSVYLSLNSGISDTYRVFRGVNDKRYSTAELKLNARARYGGFYFVLFNGPREITQHYSFINANNTFKSYSIMPYYENFLYKKNLKLSIYASYTKDLNYNVSRFNINNTLQWKAKNGWFFRFISSISGQQRSSQASLYSTNSFYNSSYFAISIKKVFNFKQPRIKYYDIETVFFKDYNGDGIKDANEAGLPNIYSEIFRATPHKDKENIDYNSQFIPTELLSNQEGKVQYTNIPEGDYKISYKPPQDIGYVFYNEEPDKYVTVNSSKTIYIPFKEQNKIFGRVILHRAKYSRAEYSLSNIRITVKGNNNIYTTLTDENGNFEISIPATETYKVEINNVFRENFNLRQSYYNVRFNGYKQFEVTFHFDEIKREVVFRDDEILETDDEFNLDSSIVIQQTHLRGEVTSDYNMKPLWATVTVIDKKNGEVISEVIASSKTGKYSTTFFTDENYALNISFDGYWNHYEDLALSQLTTFDYITRNIVLAKITKGELIKTHKLIFEKGSKELSAAARLELDNVVDKLKRNIDVNLEVTGFGDDNEIGNSSDISLSQNRALVVMNYLIKKGIDANRLFPKGEDHYKAELIPFNKISKVELIVKDFTPEPTH